MKQKTKVIFRTFIADNDAVAYFPEIPGTLNLANCLCYASCGQHSAAYAGAIENTRPSTKKEIKILSRELNRIGYVLEPRKRFSQSMRDARKNELRRIEKTH